MATLRFLSSVIFQQPFVRFVLVDNERLALTAVGMPHFVDRTMGHTFTVSVNPMKDIVWQIYNLADSSKVYVSDKTAGSAKQVHTITVAANDLPAANTEYLLRVWHAGSGGENFSCEMELKTL